MDKFGHDRCGRRHVEAAVFIDIDGKFLWAEYWTFRRLFAIGQDFIRDRINYTVKAQELKDHVLIVMVGKH